MTWQQDGESPDTFDERGEIANRLSEASKYFGDQKIKNAKGKNPETPAPNTTIKRTSPTIDSNFILFVTLASTLHI